MEQLSYRAMHQRFTRRQVLLGFSFALAGCTTVANIASQSIDSRNSLIYGPISDPPFTIPALDLAEIDPGVLRQEVAYRGPYRPGTVIVNVSEHRLYLVANGDRALRFGVGVGREEALNFHGSAVVGQKARWPRWTPTASMIARIPKYAAYAAGLPGGPNNPLGARALYLYRDGHDTSFRLHGTNEPGSIGQAVSSGCIRLFNHDIIYLYTLLAIGTPVVVGPETLPEIS
jgi:lipoprotein-anchoring transpeptidase ErfK/SrfK